MKSLKFNKTEIALAFSLLALRPAFAADAGSTSDVASAQSQAAAAEAAADGNKEALAEIDFRISAIEEQLSHAPDQASRRAVEARLEKFKEQRSELRRRYVRAKVDELKTDVALEYARVSVWVKDAYASTKEKIAGPQPDAAAKVRAAVNPEANKALAQIAVYRLNPSAENKQDVKEALSELDKEIDRLKAHAKTLPEGDERQNLEKRIEALKARESELSRDFTKARWDAMIADLRHEWNELFK